LPANVVPVKVPASDVAVMLMFEVPSKATPLIVLGVARAVAVAALPVTLPEIGAVTVRLPSVPTEVNEELTTVGLRVVPVKVPASEVAVMLMLDVPSKETPLIVRGVASAVAVAALPVTLPEIGAVTVRLPSVPTEVNEELTTVGLRVVPVKVAASDVAVMLILEVPSKATPLIVLGVARAVAVAALPVTLPEIGAVTVRLPSVPTEVREEVTTVGLRVVPVKVAASDVAVMLILDVPSKATPLIVLGVARAVAVAALPVTLPEIGAVTVRLPSVPTEVKDEAVTLPANVVPVKVPASDVAVMLILEVPSKATPLIVLGVASAVAVAALPVTLPEIGAVTVRLPSVPTEVKEELTTVGLRVVPVKVAASDVAVMLMFEVPSKATPLIVLGVANAVAVAALPVTLPEIGAVTVRLPSVPTEVREEESTFAASVLPVKVPASDVAVMLMFEVPSKATPLIVLGVARAVAVAALPVTLPEIGAVTVRLPSVPTEVREEESTFAASVLPVKVPASDVAVMLILEVPSKATPLIVLGVARAVAVAALPVTLPEIGAVTVRLPSVPTEVNEELTTVGLRVVPVKVPASDVAVMLILDVPSKATPLIVLGVARAVAVAALPVILPEIGAVTVRLPSVPTEGKRRRKLTTWLQVVPVKVPASDVAVMLILEVPSKATPLIVLGVARAVAVAALPVTLPEIGAVTVRLPSVPTEVREEESTFAASVLPVKVPASDVAVMLILDVPSKATPLIVLGVASAVAVAALPVTLPEIGAVTVRLPSVPTEVNEEVTTVGLRVVPVKVPASDVAVMLILEVPSKATPLIVLGVARAVAVAALPVTLPEIGAVTVRLPSVPTEVNEELTTVGLSVVPVKVAASDVAVMLMFEVPSKATPLIVLGVARAVAVAALPVTLPEIGAVTVRLPSVPTEVREEESTFAASVLPVKVPASDVAVMLILEVPSKATPLIVLGVANAVAVAALPVTLPEIGAVTVRLPSVPTEVREEESTFAASVLPVKVPASEVAVMLMFEVPSKATPLIVLGVASAVAVAALPVTLPEIGAVTVRLPSVPTEVNEELTTVGLRVVPVKVPASDVAVMLILDVPSKATPLIVLGVASAVAVAALPVTLPEIGAVTVRLPSVPTEVNEELTTVGLRVVPVKVPASDVAVMLILEVPSKATPLIVLGVARAVAVAALPVTLPEIGAVTVRLPSVPTEVKDEAVTLPANVVPVKVAASDVAVMLILEVPSKATPLIVLGVARAVAVAALPVTLPEIGAVTVRLPSVPTEVNEELTTVGLSVVPVKVAASDVAVMLMFEVPSKATPLIVLGVARAVAVAALPVTLPEIGAVTVRLPSVPTEGKRRRKYVGCKRAAC
jgi:hypothetical protein